MNGLKLIFTLLLVMTVAQADQIATTEDGKKVLLRPDNTWRFLKENESLQTVAPNRTSLVEIVRNSRDFDFRKVRWGMGKKEVLASEEAKLIKNEENSIEYEVQFLGYNCSVLYTFSNGALVRAAFLIRQPHVDPALYYKDYADLKAYLAPIYGSAVSDICDWKNEMYRNDQSKWGFAVSLGFLTCRTEWQNTRTRTTLSINGGNHQIMTNLEYAVRGKQ